ncbi:MAG: hypothetical protein IH598_12885 [Bacteroidales bacterium]|nr:hypothetical protein [Bacteroidales bacterium]
MKKFIILILICTLVIATSCNSEKRHNYIILLDNSRSISEQLLNRYLDIIVNSIVPNLGRYDRLTIQFIDECALTKAERVFSVDLDKINFSNAKDGMNNIENSVKARLHRFLVDTISRSVTDQIMIKRDQRKECGNYTDIINALISATTLITRERSYLSVLDKLQNSAKGADNYEYENVLIIFSDMVQENRDQALEFSQMGRMSKKQVYQKLEDIRNLNKIPDLSGCKVFIYGATSSEKGAPLANKQIENVRMFWETYFADSNAELEAYSFDCKKEISNFMAVSRN